MGSMSNPQKLNLLITLPFPRPDALIEKLQKSNPNLDITFHQLETLSSAIPAELFSKIHVLFTLMAALPAPIKSAAPDLRLVHFYMAGIDSQINTELYTSTSIPLTTSSGVHGPTIAEWVMLTALVQSRRYNSMYEMQKARQWGKLPAPEGKTGVEGNVESQKTFMTVRDMVGQRFGILGYGSIGRQVGRLARAMGMSVVAYTVSPRQSPESKRDAGYVVPGTGDPEGDIPEAWYSGADRESLHRFLGADLDYLLISVPLTPDTTQLLGAQEFKILGKRNAFVVNISRGEVLAQDALIAALKDETLRGAALDVADPEPLPKDSPLWDAPNTTITPHMSGLSRAYTERSMDILRLNIENLQQGKSLINEVNRKRGY